MADPVFVDCIKNTWQKVATNVTVGQIHKVSVSPNVYRQTYRDTGGAAPTLESDGVLVFAKSDSEQISSDAPIDVYIWAYGDNDGRVRVDL